MRFFKGTLRNSIYGLLGNPVTPSDSMLETGTEDIREALLALMAEAGTKQFANVTRRVRYANDVQALVPARRRPRGAGGHAGRIGRATEDPADHAHVRRPAARAA